jgi:hypothetical protein
MLVSIRGKVQEGKLELSAPVPLPDGTEVIVQIEPMTPPPPPPTPEELQKLQEEDPLFGMWADREDMKDSVAWVRRERKKWWRQDAVAE